MTLADKILNLTKVEVFTPSGGQFTQLLQWVKQNAQKQKSGVEEIDGEKVNVTPYLIVGILPQQFQALLGLNILGPDGQEELEVDERGDLVIHYKYL